MNLIKSERYVPVGTVQYKICKTFQCLAQKTSVLVCFRKSCDPDHEASAMLCSLFQRYILYALHGSG